MTVTYAPTFRWADRRARGTGRCSAAGSGAAARPPSRCRRPPPGPGAPRGLLRFPPMRRVARLRSMASTGESSVSGIGASSSTPRFYHRRMLRRRHVVVVTGCLFVGTILGACADTGGTTAASAPPDARRQRHLRPLAPRHRGRAPDDGCGAVPHAAGTTQRHAGRGERLGRLVRALPQRGAATGRRGQGQPRRPVPGRGHPGFDATARARSSSTTASPTRASSTRAARSRRTWGRSASPTPTSTTPTGTQVDAVPGHSLSAAT